MNGKDWNKKDTTYYCVYYTNSYGERELDVVTNNFAKWLQQANKSRVNQGEEPYEKNDFLLKVEVFR
jgi:hypothetical protein